LTLREPTQSSNRRVRVPLVLMCILALSGPHGATVRAVENRAAPAQQAKGGDFRARAMGEMESVLGAPVTTHQDAINAAYLSVGWTWGAETPDELDDAAYRKAWAWGFRIEEFASTRDERFAADHLSSSPVRPYDVASEPREVVSRARQVAAASPAADQETQQAASGASRVEHERILDVERRVAEAQREISRISEQIGELEQRSAQAVRMDPGERKAELDTLKRSLEDSHDTLAALHLELRAVVSAVERQ
jgi:hypothetical protein